MTRYQASVTFEFDEAALETFRTTVAAGMASTACSRAVTAARHARPNTRFASLVVVLEPLAEVSE